ncbi:MAG: circularly permuted type 2 ATP-grasp protein, partial [Oceanococcus sp.]
MQALFNAYRPAPGRYDELIDADGRMRPHWGELTGAISALDKREMAERQADMHRMLVEHGVSYNVYDGNQAVARTWPMDLLPMLVESRVWRDVEVGIAQRAELLRQLMHDIYGPQKLLRSGLLPAHIVFAHHGFLLPCMNANVPLEHQLIIYGADLGRSPDGRIWVTGDRTQAPSGIGYALAARTVSSRVLPSAFRESNVHPILPFLRDFRTRLIQLAENDLSRIAILTPGSSNETYSEQAYLARHLGLPLLQGEDLEFHRGGCSYVGTKGRQEISVLLRRMDDDFCDPLELNRSSFIGSPGLLQGVRNRRLNFANPLGSGVLENPALMAFLPDLCREVLGEELKLPSQDTWWCGRPDDLAYVVSHFDDMVIRSFRPSARHPTLAVSSLTASNRRALLNRIKAKPTEFVAQQRLAQASAPVWQGGAIESYPLEMRTFALNFNGGYRVMSGGFARAAKNQDSWRFSGQLGGVGKDIWVLSSEPQRAAQTLPQFLPSLQRSQQLAQPHVAENLIWLGRYTARADMLTRMLLQAYEHLAEGRPSQDGGPTQTLLSAITWQTTLYPGFVGPVGANNLLTPMPTLFHVHCSERIGSLRQDIRGMRDAVEPLRDLLVPEAYSLLS